MKNPRRLAGLLNPLGITRRQFWNSGRRRWCYVLDSAQLTDLQARYGAGADAADGPGSDLDKASTENERNALVMRLPDGERVSVVQVAGLIARRILCYVKQGEALTRGQRYGFIRFGSRVDVYLPLSARPKVAVGDKVYATTTVLADLLP